MTDFNSLGKLLNSKESIKKRGAAYAWQDHAVRIATKLEIKKLSKNWFKLFRDSYKQGLQNLLDATYSAIADLPKYNPEKYFYKVFWIKKNGDRKLNSEGRLTDKLASQKS